MGSPHDEKYEFVEPQDVPECKERMKLLLRGIRNIEKQLGDKNRNNPNGGGRLSPREYFRWRSSASSSLIYKKEEYEFLRSWLTEHRRIVLAGHYDIRDPNNPEELLLVARTRIQRVLADTDDIDSLAELSQIIDQYLQHRARRF